MEERFGECGGRWRVGSAHSVPIYRGGGTFLNLDSSILYIFSNIIY